MRCPAPPHQPLQEISGGGLGQAELEALDAQPELAENGRQDAGRQRALRAQAHGLTLVPPEGGGLGSGSIRRRMGRLQMGKHRPAQRGELGQVALPVKQGPTQLLLQALDGTVSAGWETLQASAALVKFSVLASARK
jgi:hypothetical protein